MSRAGGLLTTSFAYTASSDLFKLAQIKHETSSGGGSSVISQFDYTWNARQDITTWTRKLGSTAERETKYDLGHDAAHQLVSATLKQVSNNAVIADQRWGFDGIGNRLGEHDLVSGVRTEYTHNSTNQLVSKQTYSNGQKPWVKGSLDEPGHVNLGAGPVAVKADGSFEGQAPARTTTITAKDRAGNTTTETWQLNSGSGAAADATFTYTHDSEGNLLGDGTSIFEWDLRNRLAAIVTGTHRTEFTYDGSDRRVRVVEKEGGSVTSDLRYIYHGLSLLEERASNNSTVLRWFYSGGHVDIANGGTRYAYTTDHLGSIREVMQLAGTSGNPTTATLAARYDYDLWGKRTVLDGGTAAETLVLHGYTGHIRHAWSGLWLAPYRAYNSGLGRWISRDPIAEDGGINLYGYVGNRVLMAIDPLGLKPTMNMFPPGDAAHDRAENSIPSIPGVISVPGHGAINAPLLVGPDKTIMTPSDLAKKLKPEIDRANECGKPPLIWLPACYLGAGHDGKPSFAQQVADKTGCPVWATAGPVLYLAPEGPNPNPKVNRSPDVAMPDWWLPQRDPHHPDYQYTPGWQMFKPRPPN